MPVAGLGLTFERFSAVVVSLGVIAYERLLSRATQGFYTLFSARCTCAIRDGLAEDQFYGSTSTRIASSSG